MGVLEGIAAGAQGFTQGAAQGMDLYDRYSQMQDRATERYKRKAFEDKAVKIAQDPNLRNDPIGISTALANEALNLGDTDLYDKFTQAAQSARNQKIHDLGYTMHAKLAVDPKAAVSDLNQMFKIYGNDDNVDLQQTPTGTRMVMSIGGKSYTKDYGADETDRMNHDILQMGMSYLVPADKQAELDIKQAEADRLGKVADAQIANYQNEAQVRSQLAGPQAASYLASANSATAAAEKYRSDIETPEERQAKLDQSKAITESYSRQNAPPTAAKLAEDLIKKPTDTLDPSAPVPLNQSAEFVGGLGTAFEGTGMGGGEAYTTASGIASMSKPDILKLANGIRGEEAIKAGQITLPNGKVLPYNPNIQAYILRLIGTLAPAPGA